MNTASYPCPIPTTCPYCNGKVEYVDNSEVYGKSYGSWPYIYLCRPCRAYVGTHPNTRTPLGTLANAPTRDARVKAKALFNPLWQNGGCMSRTAAYKWLAREMGLSGGQCHFGMFTVEQCYAAIRAIENKDKVEPSLDNLVAKFQK